MKHHEKTIKKMDNLKISSFFIGNYWLSERVDILKIEKMGRIKFWGDGWEVIEMGFRGIWGVENWGYWAELKVSHFIIYIVKMSEDRPATFKIIVPSASSAKSLSAVAPEPQEEAKTAREAKLYIIPKHRSHPLSLDIQKRPGEERKFTPSFDSFELGRLFSRKELTQEELAVFSSLHEIDEDKFRTP